MFIFKNNLFVFHKLTLISKPTAVFWKVTSILYLIICLICAFLAGLNAWRLFRSAKVGLFEVTSMANLQVLIMFLVVAVAEAFGIAEVVDPLLSTESATPTSEKIASTKVVREVFFVLGVLSVIVAAISIALVWVEVGERARKMAHRTASTLIPQTRKAAFGFEGFVAVSMIAACAAMVPFVAVIIGIIAIVVVTALYFVGYSKIYHELKSVSSVAAESNKTYYRNVILEIRRTTLAIIGCSFLLIAVCVTIVVLSLSDWKQTAPPGLIPGVVVAWQILHFAMILFGCVLLHSLRNATARKVAHNKTSDHSGSGVIPSPNDKQTAPKTETAESQNQIGMKFSGKSPTVASSVAAYQIDEQQHTEQA